MTTDAIVMLKEDHKKVKGLFREFERAGEDATSRKADLVRTMLEELTVHTYIEDQVMYPEVRRMLPDLEELILESYEEHHVVDLLCIELTGMSAEDERFDAKVAVLMENVRHHIDEEENEWFPKVREGLDRKQLQDLGARMQEIRPSAPRTVTAVEHLRKTVEALSA
jgi:hemerythrin-like domain-containing protein